DHFKPVNDVHGHDAGDQLLRSLASRLTETARPGDTIARIGGDEFVVMCPELGGETEAISVAGRIEGLLATPFQIGNAEVFLTASIGVILSKGEGTADELLRDADAAMYRAKERGGNRFEMFDDEIRTRALTRLQNGNELRRAIRGGELRLFYQPEIDLRTGDCTGVEALVRWQHPKRGLLAPIHFIPLAEENGLILPLGAWVLRTACQQAAAWRNQKGAPRSVSVNLSAREIVQPDLVTRVSEALDQSGLDPSALRLEITETSIMDDPEGAAEVLASLRDLGVRLDIDDFGTGYSSLLYLRRYAVDFLKIDRSFVAGLGQNHQDDAIVASVIDLAHAFDIGVVAEGIETMDQAERLHEMGCDFGQGFLWARPVPASELTAAFRHIDALNRESLWTR
ncbi:MAG: putative bifunctional diguanylate cyclase/phosphodiesterase, partial [Ilumatobacteraceae bacterium]